MNRRAWLEARRTLIGASDAPALVGLGFRDEFAVFRDKVEGPDPADEANPLLRLGNEMEPIVAARYCEATGEAVVAGEYAAPGGLVRHPARSWQGCSPDRLCVPNGVDGRRLVQLKTVRSFSDEWGPPGSDAVPPGYLVQVQQELGVCLAALDELEDEADLAALCRTTGELRVYTVRFDGELFALLSEVERRFWHDHVVPRVPPGPEWAERYGGAVRAKAVRKDAVAELPPLALDLVRKRAELRAVEREAGDQVKRIDAALMELMGDAAKAAVPGWKLSQVHNPGGPVPASFRRPYTYLLVREAKENQA